jgi:hypothetical protein
MSARKAALIEPLEHLSPLLAHTQPDHGYGQTMDLHSATEDSGEHLSGLRAGELAAGDLQFQPNETLWFGKREAYEVANIVGGDRLERPVGANWTE